MKKLFVLVSIIFIVSIFAVGSINAQNIDNNITYAKTLPNHQEFLVAQTSAPQQNQISLKAKSDNIEASLSGAALADYKKARKRIADVARSGAKILKISYFPEYLPELTIIPPEVANLTSLQRLYFSGTKVSDISVLQGLTELQNLDLSYTKVSDITALQGLTGLQRLDLSYTKVSDISALKGMAGLQDLFLINANVSDISALKGLTGLQTLWLSFTNVSDISALKGMTGLQKLFLINTEVSDISALQGLTGLQWLDLSFTKVSDISVLQGLTELQNLDLSYTEVSDWSPVKHVDFSGHPKNRIKYVESELGINYYNLAPSPLAEMLSQGEGEWMKNATLKYGEKTAGFWKKSISKKVARGDVSDSVIEKLREFTPQMLTKFAVGLSPQHPKYGYLQSIGALFLVEQITGLRD